MNTEHARDRVATELQQLLPVDLLKRINLNVRVAKDPVLDAWRGAAFLASRGGDTFVESCISRADYEEMGPEYLKEHMASNVYYQRPVDPKRDAKRRRR